VRPNHTPAAVVIAARNARIEEREIAALGIGQIHFLLAEQGQGGVVEPRARSPDLRGDHLTMNHAKPPP